ncbi:MAG: oxidoreductase [Alphaproteobacteria bacterium]|nr:oxidoreductase [Alphaproteobacteria bacterium]
MDVKIYKPSKNAMQSGRAKTENWILEYETETPRDNEPLMGWISSEDTLNQVQLKFKSQEDAVSFANKKNWNYVVLPEQKRRVKPRNYTDNFK